MKKFSSEKIYNFKRTILRSISLDVYTDFTEIRDGLIRKLVYKYVHMGTSKLGWILIAQILYMLPLKGAIH